MPNNNKKHTIKQHYVPRAFLERWCRDGVFYPIKASGVNVEDIKILPRSGVYSFCFENYFYGNERGKKDEFSQDVEKYMTDLESKMYDILDKFEEKILKGQTISYLDKLSIAEIMSFFDIRGKRGAERSDDMLSQLFNNLRKNDNLQDEEIMKLVGATPSEIILKDNNKVEMSTQQRLQQLWRLEHISHHIANKDWFIKITRQGEFIVTDTPYFEVFPEYTGVLSQTIYDRMQVFILSPRVVIFARKPVDMYDVRYYLYNENLPISNSSVYTSDVSKEQEAVDTVNATLFDYNIRFGFHHNKNVLDRIILYIKNFVK